MAPMESNIESSPSEQPAPEAPPPVHTIVVDSAGAAPAEAPPPPPTVEAAPAQEPAEVVEAAPAEPAGAKSAPTAILVIDIGGTKVKILASGQTEPRKAPSGKDFTPARLV